MRSELKSEAGIIVTLEAVLYCYHSIKAVNVPRETQEFMHRLHVLSEKCNRVLSTIERTPKSMILSDCCKIIEMLTDIAFFVPGNTTMYTKVKGAHREMIELLHANI
jgi:hypothetical protein